MAKRFHDAVVFITGGTSGLGAQTCKLFLGEGARVFVTDLKVKIVPMIHRDNQRSSPTRIWHKLKPTDNAPLFPALYCYSLHTTNEDQPSRSEMQCSTSVRTLTSTSVMSQVNHLPRQAFGPSHSFSPLFPSIPFLHGFVRCHWLANRHN